MKKVLFITAILCLCAAAADYDVVGLKLYREGDNTVVEALTSGPATVKTARLQNPDRIIVDLIGGVHRLKDKDLPPLPQGIVMELRTAQFQSSPPITRIVLVLAEPVGEVQTGEGPRFGKAIIPTPGYPAFPEWSIARATPASPAVPKKETTEPTISEPPPGAKPTPQSPAETPAEKTPEENEYPVQRAFIAGDSLGGGASYIRPLVIYRGWDKPDPFVVAKPATESKIGEEAFPIVEDLKIVGIVAGRGIDKIAILQDARGWGYILGTGDSIKGGIVDSVTDSTITFNIEEFGVIRQVVLTLPKEVFNR